MILCWTKTLATAAYWWTTVAPCSSSSDHRHRRHRHHPNRYSLMTSDDMSQTVSINEPKSQPHGIEDVTSTITPSNANSFFSSWTHPSAIRNHETDFLELVFEMGKVAVVSSRAETCAVEENHIVRKSIHSSNAHHRHHHGGVTRRSAGSTKNQLLQPVSPFQELLGVPDLCGEVSSSSSSSRRFPAPVQNRKDRGGDDDDEVRQPSWSQRDHREERQSIRCDAISHHNSVPSADNKKKRTHHRQSHIVPSFNTIGNCCLFDIPMVITFPTEPNHSEDSELSLMEEAWKTEQGFERTVTPHPSFEGFPPPPDCNFHRHRRYHAAHTKTAENDELWPSDEDQSPLKQNKVYA